MSMTWFYYALITVLMWGTYGVLLHGGATNMSDPLNGKYKAFLFVGFAYFLFAILAPIVVLKLNGASWSFPGRGITLSLAAGFVGAAGAFGVLLAFGAKGSPAVIMSLVFAGAPIVNAVVAMLIHPPVGGISAIRWPFYLGILLAALGGGMVTLFKPSTAPQATHASSTMAPGVAESGNDARYSE